MTDDLLKRADKLNQLVMDILCQCATMKLTVNHQDGVTARWIEREIAEMIGKVKRYLDE